LSKTSYFYDFGKPGTSAILNQTLWYTVTELFKTHKNGMNAIHTYNHNQDSLPHRFVDFKNDVQCVTVEIKLVGKIMPEF
jgi:hypothetical protein